MKVKMDDNTIVAIGIFIVALIITAFMGYMFIGIRDEKQQIQELCESKDGELIEKNCRFIEDGKLVSKKIVRFKGKWRLIES